LGGIAQFGCLLAEGLKLFKVSIITGHSESIIATAIRVVSRPNVCQPEVLTDRSSAATALNMKPPELLNDLLVFVIAAISS
jgi:hypothetical protein